MFPGLGNFGFGCVEALTPPTRPLACALCRSPSLFQPRHTPRPAAAPTTNVSSHTSHPPTLPHQISATDHTSVLRHWVRQVQKQQPNEPQPPYQPQPTTQQLPPYQPDYRQPPPRPMASPPYGQSASQVDTGLGAVRAAPSDMVPHNATYATANGLGTARATARGIVPHSAAHATASGLRAAHATYSGMVPDATGRSTALDDGFGSPFSAAHATAGGMVPHTAGRPTALDDGFGSPFSAAHATAGGMVPHTAGRPTALDDGFGSPFSAAHATAGGMVPHTAGRPTALDDGFGSGAERPDFDSRMWQQMHSVNSEPPPTTGSAPAAADEDYQVTPPYDVTIPEESGPTESPPWQSSGAGLGTTETGADDDAQLPGYDTVLSWQAFRRASTEADNRAAAAAARASYPVFGWPHRSAEPDPGTVPVGRGPYTVVPAVQAQNDAVRRLNALAHGPARPPHGAGEGRAQQPPPNRRYLPRDPVPVYRPPAPVYAPVPTAPISVHPSQPLPQEVPLQPTLPNAYEAPITPLAPTTGWCLLNVFSLLSRHFPCTFC